MNKASKSLLLASTLILVSTASVPSVNAFADTMPTITYQTPDTTNSISFGPVISDTNSYADPTLDAMRISDKLQGSFKTINGKEYWYYFDQKIPGRDIAKGFAGILSLLATSVGNVYGGLPGGVAGFTLSGAINKLLTSGAKDSYLRVYIDYDAKVIGYKYIG
jgi:hypothetical protein